jgi:UDP-N-acetylenolpyruvoylglucosamine reductase
MKQWGEPEWMKELPPLEGGYAVSVPLAEFTTLEVGGPAEVLATVGNWEEMRALLRAAHAHGVALTVLGAGYATWMLSRRTA